MNIRQSSRLFHTPILGLAAFLYVKGHRLVDVSLQADGRRLVFYFEKNNQVYIDAGRYRDGSAEAPVRLLLEAYRELRALTYKRIEAIKEKGEENDEHKHGNNG